MNHQKQIKRITHPTDKSTLISSIFFLYTLPLFCHALKKDIKDEDLYEVPSKYESKILFKHVIKQWNLLKSKKKDTVFRLLWNSFGLYYFFLGVIKILVNTFLLIFQPFATSNIVSYFIPNQTYISKNEACFYAGGLILVKLLNGIYVHNYEMWILALGIRIRAAFFSLIYRKILKIDYTKTDNVEAEKIVTMITKDIQSFENFLVYGNDIWSNAITTIFGCILLYIKIGTAALAGIAVLWLVVPFQIYACVKSVFYERKICEKSEKRYKTVMETISAIKIIKMYAWEKIFKKKISAARKKEIWPIYVIHTIRSFIVNFSVFFVYIAQYVLLTTHTKLGFFVTAQIVFFMVTSFRLIRDNFTRRLPLALHIFGKLYPCIKRIDTFLKLPEIEESVGSSVLQNHKIMYDLGLNFTGLVIVTGATSSGKTTLLKTMMGEFGCAKIPKEISYSSQDPWMFPSTIRQNILFGEKYYENRYQKVLKVCALDYDFQTFKNGDFTIVQDGGLNLSKGQRVRISLARAVYKNCDVYLLDDCLSSLDVEVRSHVLEECICRFLEKKLVVLVSQNAEDFEYADKVVSLTNGQLTIIKKGKSTKILQLRNETLLKRSSNGDTTDDNSSESTKLLQFKEKRLYSESIRSGKVSQKVYLSYIKSLGGFIVVFFLLIIFIGTQTVNICNDMILSNWVDLEQSISKISTNNTVKLTEAEDQRKSIIFRYTMVMLFLTCLTLLRSCTFFIFTTKASIILHKKVLKVLDASMEFFNLNLIGNIFNRVSKDFNIIDEEIPVTYFVLIREIFHVVGVFVLVTMVNRAFLVLSLVTLGMLVLTRRYYLKISRSLQRLDVATRSPVVGFINSTFDGMSTIRALNMQDTLIYEFEQHLNHFTSVSYTLRSTTCAFTLVLEVLSVLFPAVILIKLFFFDDGQTTAGEAGLALSQASVLIYSIKFGLYRWAETENLMTSVERVLEYCDTKVEDQDGEMRENWPNYGEIRFNDVSLSYPDTNVILKNLTFTVNPKEKVGIVGRTGAGKSTIFSALCRLYDFQGKISIDGLDIKTVSLNQLRSSISFIPQDSVLFSGTVRDNIDPKRQRTDEELYRILEDTNLQSLVSNLDEEVEDSHFSAGQKQLLSVIRAIVCKNKIVLVDEATANLDLENEGFVQRAFKKYFFSSTVILIAHTKSAVLECDKIFVIDDGAIVEFGAPKELFQNKEGKFYKLFY